MARPRKTDYFVCKDCKNEFRKKTYTSEVVRRCQCPQCYTEEITKKNTEAENEHNCNNNN
jgi:DNA replicative helicase MCM subunit Mcm2 (Cdc46/Mcm family)